MILKSLLPPVLALLLARANAQQVIQPVDLSQAIQNGSIAIVVDVRSQEEWITGHVANATLVENLASDEFPPIDVLQGCETCTIAVMCRTGARAANAISRLQTDYGFTGTLYNALGVSQWQAQGLPLVLDVESNTPTCSSTTVGVCPMSITEAIEMVELNGELVPKYSLTAKPTMAPTSAPVVAETPTTNPVISIPSVQGNEGSTVDRSQEAQSSTTTNKMVGMATTTTQLVGLVLLSWWGLL